jgi:hypothetical protein
MENYIMKHKNNKIELRSESIIPRWLLSNGVLDSMDEFSSSIDSKIRI